jgi:probable rRNA maturation factor
MKLEIEVAELSNLWRDMVDADALARKAIEASCALARVKLRAGAEVGVQLADDEQVRALNRQWRKIDKPTNVLSFPAASAKGLASAPMLGDIVLAYETMCKEASDEGKTPRDHTAHLIVHGFLHLLGFDHSSDVQAEEMEELESRILARVGVSDPYAVPTPVGATR